MLQKPNRTLQGSYNKIFLDGKSDFKMHPSTSMLLDGNSKIVVKGGVFKCGIDFSTPGAGFDVNDNCRIHLNNSKIEIHGNVPYILACE